jgi:hypothetical protein
MTTPNLLTESQMQSFIRAGYHTVKPALTPDFHGKVHESLQDLFAGHDNPGNEILSRVPTLSDLFGDPEIDGALTSILGPDYLIHRHRHCHNHDSGAAAQDMHKDYPVGGNVRDINPRQVLILYYPQAVTPDMGPTAIQPGSQYCLTPPQVSDEMALCCDAGTVVITHYEIWHRATENISRDTRYMVKFVGMRTKEPGSNGSSEWQSDVHQSLDSAAPGGHVRKHVWNWYISKEAKDASPVVASNEENEPLNELIINGQEMEHLDHLFAVSAKTESEDKALIAALIYEAGEKYQKNLARTDYTNPSQLEMVFGISAAGNRIVGPLIETLQHDQWWARAAAAAALGAMGHVAADATSALATALKDPDEWVRRNAALAIGNLGDIAATAIPDLVAALEDRRPVTRWSLSEDAFRENVMLALLKVVPEDNRMVYAELGDFVGDSSEYVACWAKHLSSPTRMIC